MGIFIKNPEVERRVRELAKRKGGSLTAAIAEAVDHELARQPAAPRKKPTAEELHEATERFRRAIGLDKITPEPMTKADWDALWPTGIPEIDNL